ncbi:MAG: redox-regulated ATPase YchF [Anaerolineales bacterium]
MGLSIGIVGLPNVGKSTLFNALTGAQNAEVANYPFCTIKPNQAVVPVPDDRVEKLRELVDVPNAIHATIEFVDIAGLVRGAHKGEGLGNQFLGNIRDADAIVHVVRCFDDPNVVHVSGNIDPREDIEIINLELALADLQQLERKIERLARQLKGDKKFRPVDLSRSLDVALAIQDHLQAGRPISTCPGQNDAFHTLNREMRFLTGKPLIYAANVDEGGIGEETAYLRAVREVAAGQGAEVVIICARLEEEMVDMTAEERQEFLKLAGATESGLAQVIHKSHNALGLISYFTKNENEVRAWTIPEGTPAPKAAGIIHTDFERGFIRAEVIPFETYVQHGSDAAARSAGVMRLEGKSYIVQDGDVIFFRI